ncbi:hypothetical protein DFQ26_004311 [Actinomortierella ambigua]|nr:hypothetical protein DFQ26_004311 [Actinomortierella ambigua]
MSQAQLRVGHLIGHGGYGMVFSANWKRRKVAIKKFNVTTMDSEEAAMQQEIQLLEKLRDKYVIQYYGTTYYEDCLVLVMEYAEGGTLQRAIQAGHLTWDDKGRIAQEILRGLSYIHEEGVIHRDLKSQNVLLNRHNEAKICDFGLAKVKMSSLSKSSVDRSAKGTLRWMAPELFSKRPNYTTKSDMYSFGMVMWEMAANCTLPFKYQQDCNAVAALVERGEREDLPDDTPGDYSKCVERCWKHEPELRPEAYELVIDDDDETATGNDLVIEEISLSVTETMFRTRISESAVTITKTASPKFRTHSRPSSSPQSPPQSPPPPPLPPVDMIGLLLSKAKEDDVKAQKTLAKKYDEGDGVDQSLTHAFNWYHRAATLGDAEAQVHVGLKCLDGRGTRIDHKDALSWFLKSADQGDAGGQVNLGKMYLHGWGAVSKDNARALSWFRKSAEQGNADGLANLGRMYIYGSSTAGIERDYVAALSSLRKSAKLGHADGQYLLGIMYHNGWEVEKDDTEAFAWFRKSAEQGHADGQCFLGKMYRFGWGVEKSDAVALTWFRKSAERGNADGQVHLGRMYMGVWGLERNYVTALKWFCASAEQGNADAQYSLGKMYLEGNVVKKSDTVASSWFRRSAEQGNADGQVGLGNMYLNGWGVEENSAEAFALFRQAAEQGNSEGQFNIAGMYMNGIGTAVDNAMALSWYTKSADQGHRRAIFMLNAIGKDLQTRTSAIW